MWFKVFWSTAYINKYCSFKMLKKKKKKTRKKEVFFKKMIHLLSLKEALWRQTSKISSYQMMENRQNDLESSSAGSSALVVWWYHFKENIQTWRMFCLHIYFEIIWFNNWPGNQHCYETVRAVQIIKCALTCLFRLMLFLTAFLWPLCFLSDKDFLFLFYVFYHVTFGKHFSVMWKVVE